ncbi:MAG: sigma-70 family RNA polymerase sigma factor [Cyanobacteria bacterium J06635_15]
MSNEVYDQLERLNEVIKSALSPKESGTSRKLILFIRRSLNQVGLYNEWSEHEILLEAYLRAHERIKAGEVIDNLPGYLNRVSHFLILEKNKHRRRRQNIRQKLSGFTSETMFFPETSYLDGVGADTVNFLLAAFEALSERDQQILVLRTVKGYSWKEIAYSMVENGIAEECTDSLVAKLRKQGERALDKLRKRMLSVDNS